jgi:hypothetical protein
MYGQSPMGVGMLCCRAGYAATRYGRVDLTLRGKVRELAVGLLCISDVSRLAAGCQRPAPCPHSSEIKVPQLQAYSAPYPNKWSRHGSASGDPPCPVSMLRKDMYGGLVPENVHHSYVTHFSCPLPHHQSVCLLERMLLCLHYVCVLTFANKRSIGAQNHWRGL